jgi:hypothetical protein
MTDPFVTDVIEGRVLDASPRRSEELEILPATMVAECGNWLQDGEVAVVSTRGVQDGPKSGRTSI